MKKYSKPSLKELGLLRVVTKFSSCPTGEVKINNECYKLG
jgi:hypothetical protein